MKLQSLVMSIKTLIAGGDSYTEVKIDLEGRFMDMWPAHIGAEDYINVGYGGAGNSFIFNRVIDAIEENIEKELTVIVLWSDSARINLLDCVNVQLQSERQLLKVPHWFSNSSLQMCEVISEFSNLVVELMWKQQKKKDTAQGFYEKMMIQSLRYMYLLDKYCGMHGIKFYHGCVFDVLGYNTLDSLERYFDVADNVAIRNAALKNIKKSHYYNYLLNSKNFMGFDFDVSSYIKNNNLTISEINTHANQYGNKVLANLINEFIATGNKPKTDNIELSLYIYD